MRHALGLRATHWALRHPFLADFPDQLGPWFGVFHTGYANGQRSTHVLENSTQVAPRVQHAFRNA